MAALHDTMRTQPPSVKSFPGKTNGSKGVGLPVRQSNDLSYMHRPPTVTPNYGKKYRGGVKLKTNVPRVLLYDNVTQQIMLDVQLSGLQSQQYKIGRELEMHMKSFTLRKQLKDKALQKLTKVKHGGDYLEFEYQYYGYTKANEQSSKNSYAVLLPSIYAANSIKSTMDSLRGYAENKKRKHIEKAQTGNVSNRRLTKDQTLNGHVNNRHLTESHISFSNNEDTCQSIFPDINSTSMSLLKLNGADQINTIYHFVPRKRVGFRFEQTPAGTKRMLHVLSTINIESARDKDQVENEVQEIAAVWDANRVEDVHTDTQQEEMEEKRTDDSELVADDDITNKQARTNIHNNPVFDTRFKQLEELLVRQEPPNEGFTELSPSFIREYLRKLIPPENFARRRDY